MHGGDSIENYYGKFSLSWSQISQVSKRLNVWLDPDNTGTITLEGTYMMKKPKVMFSTGLTQVCHGAPVIFSDKSKYLPDQWNWIITPSGYAFANGTNSNSRNPAIAFNDGVYTITLIVSNAYGSDTLTKVNYIQSGNLQVSFTPPNADSIVCGCNLNNYPLVASGATSYVYTIQRTDKIGYVTKLDSLFLSLIAAEKKNGSFNSWVKVTGTQGSCSVSDSLLLKVIMPPNDDVENSVQLWPGRSGVYSNFCASVQQNEPHPPTSSCIAANSWCPIAGTIDKALNNTIWFNFMAPPNGLISIVTHGITDRIALYDADQSSNIVSGDPTLYKILAANDGRSHNDSMARLDNISVVPYKQYWLQIDGTNKVTGNCTIDLLSNSIEVFPNPSSGQFNIIISGMASGTADVTILSPIGSTVYSDRFNVPLDSNHFNFDLSHLAQGIYYMRVKINGTVMTAKLMKIN